MINVNESNKLFHLQTEKSSYILGIHESGQAVHFYYGPRLRHRKRFENLGTELPLPRACATSYREEDPAFSLLNQMREYGEWGKGDYRIHSVELSDSRGDRTFDFQYRGYRLEQGKTGPAGLPSALPGKNTETLILEFRDLQERVEMRQIYSLFPEEDCIVRRSELQSLSGDLTVENLMSLSLDLPPAKRDLTTLQGSWIRERHRSRGKLQPGITEISSRRGNSSHDSSPFLMLQESSATEFQGESLGVALIYSGSYLTRTELSSHGLVRIQMGLHPGEFRWKLTRGETFQTPEAVLTRSSLGSNGMSGNFHRFIQQRMVRGPWKEKERPVLINNWEATYMDFTEKKLLKLADEARDLGIELFVLDDGWFGKRDDDHRSLGDWTPNLKKLPGGLKGLAEKIRKKGLDFGIWVEPEMVNPDSDLYRNHPGWMVRSPGQEPSPSRHQFLLDLTQKEVREYLKEALSALLDSAEISYMKWDMNRSYSDGWTPSLPPDRQGEWGHRMMLGLYEILDYLQKRYPELLLESCASGGGRFDLAMLCYSPQVWTSDNTDAVERLAIQEGTSLFAPPSTMGAHVSARTNHQVLRQTPLESRFNTACFGVLGYELDLTKLKPFEKKIIAKQITFYKENRRLIQFGRFSRLESSDSLHHCWMIQDKGKALLGYFQILATPNPPFERIFPAYLKESGLYRVSIREQFHELSRFGELAMQALPVNMKEEGLAFRTLEANYLLKAESQEFQAGGDQLLYRGIEPLPQFYGTGKDEALSIIGDYGSRLYIIEEITDQE